MKNTKYMMAIAIVTSMDFFSAVEIAFFIGKSLTELEIYSIYSIFSILIFLLEVPTGYIGDKLGYKTSLFLGYLCGIIGTVGFLFGKGFMAMLISYFFMALMSSLISGTEEALIYDSLLECNEEQKFEEIYGKIKAFGYLATIIGSIMAGFIASYNIQWNAIGNGCMIVLAGFFLWFVREPVITEKNSKVNTSKFVDIFEECKGLWCILFIAGFFMTSTLVGTKVAQPIMIAGGIPLTFFGFFSAACSIINSVASYFTKRLERLSFGIIMVFPSIMLLLIGLSQNGILVILLFLTAASRAIGNVKITARLNEKIPSDSKHRATINSVKSLIFRIIYAVVIWCVGIIADYSIFVAIFVAGGITLLGISIIIFYQKKKKIKGR